jgi:hypothetical protein
MGVMGLGENGLKVPGGLDVAIWGIYMCTKTLGQKTFLLRTPSHNQIS